MNTPLHETDDLELVRRYCEQDDREALGILFERYADMVYRMALRVMRNPSEAEDTAQAAFVQIMRALPKYRGGAGLRVWMMKIVVGVSKQTIRKSIRRRDREERVVEEDAVLGEESGVDSERASELAEVVKPMLDNLPEKYRLPIWMHHYEGMPYHDIAVALSSSENTLRSQVRRGLDMLRGSLSRAGLSVPTMSIVAVLPSLSSETAPATLLSHLGSLVAEGNLAAGAGSATKVISGASRGIGAKAVITAGVVVASAAVGTAVWKARKEQDPTLLVPTVTAPEQASIDLHWDFNTPAHPKEFIVHEGGWRYVPGAGVDGSGCMETDGTYLNATLDTPLESLPLLLTFRARIINPELDKNYTFGSTWTSYESAAILHGASQVRTRGLDPRNPVDGPWENFRHYITPDLIARWKGNVFHDLTIIKRRRGARLQIGITGRQRVDDLRLVSIRPEEVPDLSGYLAAIEKIPPAKRVGKVPLPGLKPGRRSKQVSVRFFPASR